MKKQCRYCGNNPVPHFMTWVNESMVVLFTPFNYVAANPTVHAIFGSVMESLFSLYIKIGERFKWVTYNSDMTSVADSGRATVLWEEAIRRGIPMESVRFFGKEVDYYRAQLPNGPLYFRGLPRPQSADTRSMLWMDDKGILKDKLSEAHIPVARGGSFATYAQLVASFRYLEKPVIVKPRLGSRGRHTTTFIYTEEQLRKAFTIAKQLCHWVVMEEHLTGAVYRGTVIGGKLAGVLGGAPPRVLGDGTHTIQELVTLKNNQHIEGVHEIKITDTTVEFLARSGYTLDTILPAGKEIDLTEKIGVSYGGTSFEVTDETHPDTKRILEQAAAVVGDVIMGFDFIIPDITKSPFEQKWGIIECNAVPFINLHHHPLYGKPRNVAANVWELFEN